MFLRDCLDLTLEELEKKLAAFRGLTSPFEAPGKPVVDVPEIDKVFPHRGTDYWLGIDLYYSFDRATLLEKFGVTHEAIRSTMNTENEEGIPEEKQTQYWPKSVKYPEGLVIKPE